MSELFSLFFSFFKVGLFTFGGGYAMLPIIEREIVEKKKWITSEELLEYFSLSQCTPGVIAVNTATFVGSKKRGFWGAMFATIGVIVPSILIIVSLANILQRLDKFPAVNHAFAAIRPAVAALIFGSFISIFKANVKSIFEILLCIVSFILVAFFNISPIIVVIIGTIFGLSALWKRGAKT
ncbi:MAG: chromate transporter [Oscillospiraceae bacterium]